MESRLSTRTKRPRQEENRVERKRIKEPQEGFKKFFNSYEDAKRAEAYAKLEFPGTYYLAYRDLPQIIRDYAKGSRAFERDAQLSHPASKGIGVDAKEFCRAFEAANPSFGFFECLADLPGHGFIQGEQVVPRPQL